MKEQFKRRFGSFSSIGLVVACTVLIFVTSLNAQEAGASSGRVSQNEQGLAYGIMADSLRSETAFDLVAAVATNGNEGYVYSNDLDRAVENGVTNPEEAVAYMKGRENIAVGILSSELYRNNEISSMSLDDPNELALLWDSIQQNGLEAAFSEKTNLMDLNSGQANREIVDSIRVELNNALAVSIPVYEQDGQTVIGEFLVGEF